MRKRLNVPRATAWRDIETEGTTSHFPHTTGEPTKGSMNVHSIARRLRNIGLVSPGKEGAA